MSKLHYDIVGSFLRPKDLKNARADFEDGKISKYELVEVENKNIKKLVDQEIAAGLKIVTDGEFRRSYWHLDTFWGFNGIAHIQKKHGYLFHDEETRKDSAIVNGKISFSGDHPDLEAFKFLRNITKDKNVIPRQSIPSPAQFYSELIRDQDNITAVKKYYPNEEDLFTDISTAYRNLILALYEAGCRDLKLDDCTWGVLVDQNLLAIYESLGFTQNQLCKIFLKLNNDAIDNLPDDLRISTHICRGNYHSTWATSGGYDAVADYVFAKENVDAFYLEFDDERSGHFDPIAKIPADKEVVLGIVTSKKPELEDPTKLKERIKEATAFHNLDKLALSTQCGFSSTEEGNKLTDKEQWDKINLVLNTANEIWN
ncbi:5-methyltetrahydropteroyltriglutamate--homocysteine S-methyltransferase [Lactobacillus sp.]|uniref:5-methyltetrahydropteroyltriglutamate-- homocysteine S-methyltransferase n=1 Tax=Lactobacillus sp. TaxID=1591 RepID=UPI0019B255A8|nr:5-methyltetrahydropteroyltriglutamate--homocysteine S-methyltransferase [Lactobacillus sp.]MBD5429056.1 5-methyltetrahydropteroyltriglutamate--homocysteine S-methyltransferase [Lactobacillus sp.]MBD5430242.1 5-methyltetrahydropteroyltriglutamate--homocysteine S-methyltransferase [Lactobacillus sp.]